MAGKKVIVKINGIIAGEVFVNTETEFDDFDEEDVSFEIEEEN